MSEVNRSALVEFSAEQMFDLVNDVESYPVFLPWCSGSEVLEQSETELKGKIDLSKAGVKQSFTTLNALSRPESIIISLVEGPFSKLNGSWHFIALTDNACKVTLQLEFDFLNAMLRAVVGPVFNLIANSMLESFVKRAAEIHKKE
ncbi:Ribosome association toxin RatA [hydrothermal vent metagenome]|uniref:Ribosome association toxin RatA n=1 Tax=hydrothermal vent metagenome TaxID=652676 RepID=A0A3B0YBQ9_9ZZZZ